MTDIKLAISIRQPFCELILLGVKKYEFRSKPTNVRERVFIYAGLQWHGYMQDPKTISQLEKHGVTDMPRGLLVGSVEIVDCLHKGDDDYAWKLANPIRFTNPFKPSGRPMPMWWTPILTARQRLELA